MPKLDRIPHFDPRSRDYSVRALLPRTVERRQRLWALPANFPTDQGQEGRCVAFGYGGELAAEPVVIPTDTEWANAFWPRVVEQDRAMGNHWPDGASMLAGAKAAKAAGLIGSYRWAFSLNDLIDTLVEIGPVILGIPWRESMYQTRLDGIVTVDGPVVGGHCILANGYWPNHPKFGEVIVWTNSWGRSYGLDGVGFIRVADLAGLLEDQGEAAIVVDVTPTPPPPPAPVQQVFVAARYSRAFHRVDAHWWIREDILWSTREAAVASGLRPCRLCKP